MNFTAVTTSFNTTRRQIKLQEASILFGVVLAAIAMSAFGASEGRSEIRSPQDAALVPLRTTPVRAIERFVLLVTGSQQQADEYRTQFAQDAALSDVVDASLSVGFVVLSNADDEARFISTYGEMAVEIAQLGFGFQVVDVRGDATRATRLQDRGSGD